MGGPGSGLSRKRRTLPRQVRPNWLLRLDQRSTVARQLHDRLLGIGEDQGGLEAMSTIHRGLTERYVHCEALAIELEARAAAGQAFDVSQYLMIVDRVTRLALALGLERRARRVPSFQEYLASPVEDSAPASVDATSVQREQDASRGAG